MQQVHSPLSAAPHQRGLFSVQLLLSGCGVLGKHIESEREGERERERADISNHLKDFFCGAGDMCGCKLHTPQRDEMPGAYIPRPQRPRVCFGSLFEAAAEALQATGDLVGPHRKGSSS